MFAKADISTDPVFLNKSEYVNKVNNMLTDDTKKY